MRCILLTVRVVDMERPSNNLSFSRRYVLPAKGGDKVVFAHEVPKLMERDVQKCWESIVLMGALE